MLMQTYICHYLNLYTKGVISLYCVNVYTRVNQGTASVSVSVSTQMSTIV